ncbi:hypothetical protein QTP88_012765 [Uroleucon formosanum]
MKTNVHSKQNSLPIEIDRKTKIAEGVTMEKILDDIKENVHDILKIQTLITKKDLWNIKSDFNLYEGCQH